MCLQQLKIEPNVNLLHWFIAPAELMELFPWVEFIEYPEVKSSWVKRLYFEYITCNRLSKVIKATHWVCLHDITANVSVPYRFVYCHNPAPFYKYLSYRMML